MHEHRREKPTAEESPVSKPSVHALDAATPSAHGAVLAEAFLREPQKNNKLVENDLDEDSEDYRAYVYSDDGGEDSIQSFTEPRSALSGKAANHEPSLSTKGPIDLQYLYDPR